MTNFSTTAVALFMCALGCAPSPHAAETRPATDQERSAFEAFHTAQSRQGARPPIFNITRNGAEPWRVEAYQDGQPRRALRALCRMNRKVFTYDGRWHHASERQFAWHDAAKCGAPSAPIALGQRMPDTDILALIEQQAALLKRARLLFAGNTACAPQRAYNYRLAGIDVSVFIDGSEEMATLTYLSDRGPTARVWARRTGLAYDPWNVSCP